MANVPVLDLTKLSPAELAQLQRVLAAMNQGIPASTAPDLTKVPTVFICHNPKTPHASLQEDIDAADKHRDGDARGKCPECGAPVGAAPAAINDKIIRFEHQAALRAGDAAVMAIYYGGSLEDSASGDVEIEEVKPTPIAPPPAPQPVANTADTSTAGGSI